MLQNIRDYTQGWIAGIIISLVILSFALWGIKSYLLPSGSSNVVAKVDGVEITKNQLAVAYDRLRRQLQIQYNANTQLPEKAEQTLKQRALQTLIDLQVLRAASYNNNYRISTSQIDSFLENIPEFQIDGEFSQNRFQQVLNATLFSASDFINLIKTTLLIDQPRLGVIFTSISLPNEVAEVSGLIGQQRDINYLIIPNDYSITAAPQITAEQIQRYYTEHQKEFKTPEQVSLQYIELSLDDLINKIRPTAEAVKKFYDENTNSFLQPAQWKLESITLPLAENAVQNDLSKAKTTLEAIKQAATNGTDFVTLRHDFNAIPQEEETLRDWVTADHLPIGLEKTILALNKPGEISSPVRTASGLTMIRVIGYKAPQAETFAKSQDKVTKALARQQAEEKFADLREKLANLTYVHPDNLTAAAKELGLEIKSTALFSKEKAASGIISNVKVRQAAFSPDVMGSTNNSDVIQLDPDTALVIRIKSHIPANSLPLNAVDKQIRDKLTLVIADQNLQIFTKDLLVKLKTNSLSATDISAKYHLDWVKAGFTGRHAPKIDLAILNAAFAMPKPIAAKMAYTLAKTANGYAIIELAGVQNGKMNSKQDYVAMDDQVQTSQGLLEYQSYKNSLLRKAKITVTN
jgi:peptidyl-prolyl cis-trans isomerase D